MVIPAGVVCDRCNGGQLSVLDQDLAEFFPIKVRRTTLAVPSKAGKIPVTKFQDGTLRHDGTIAALVGDLGPKTWTEEYRSRKDPRYTIGLATLTGGRRLTARYAERLSRAVLKVGFECAWPERRDALLGREFDAVRDVIRGARRRGYLFVGSEVDLKTGMRQGELLALTWGDVDLVHSVIHVRRTYTDGNLGSPKNHEKREVFVTEEVVDLLGSWWGSCGKPADEKVVLPGETKTGYLNPQVILRRQLYPAMERAGIPRVGPTGEKRTFHSLRHTFARIAIEHNRPIFWLSKHLGHSSLDVTSNVYGHFEKATRKREAEAMAGVFGV